MFVEMNNATGGSNNNNGNNSGSFVNESSGQTIIRRVKSSARRHKTTDSIGTIYMYKNDPKVVNKGVNVSNFRHAQDGFLPLLADNNYQERKLDNLSYSYDDRMNHGTRPMHQTTFNLGNSKSDFITKNKLDFQGNQLRPEYIPIPGKDVFQSQIDLAMNNQRYFGTSYQNHFYTKNNDKEYVENFEVMPKYSIPKQIYQLETEGKIKSYRNRQANIKEVIASEGDDTNYWTQYNRIHNYLGALRGSGQPREIQERSSYNIITGEQLTSPSWSTSANYRKVSGNVLLGTTRKGSANIID